MFDEDRADRAVRFIRALSHTKGEWAGRPFNLMPWEEKIVRDLFGTLNEDGTRQYREAYISVARKNGKTELTAAIALYCLYADGEIGAEVYCAAADRDQASLVFNAAKSMVENNSTLFKASKILDSVKRIVFNKKNSFMRAISSESYTKHGYNPSMAINDEVHVWPSRDLYDVLKTGMGARKQPLIINITTAGFDRNSLCYELYDYAKKIQDGIIDDPTFYVSIFEVEEKDDWKEEQTWYKANPGLGIYRELKEMRDAFKRACEVPAFENTFRRLYCNQWTEQNTRWMAIERWDACLGEVEPGDLIGRTCYVGLDLSSTRDLTALVLVFPPINDEKKIKVLPFFFLPRDSIQERAQKDRVPYDQWARRGLIQTTDGNVIDYDFVLAKIKELGQKYDIREIAYDRWGATKLATDLQNEGVTIVPMGQGFASMSAPTKELEKLIMGRLIEHDGNEVLRWMFNNISIKTDPAGNVKIDKAKSSEKVDGIVALVMAIDRHSRNENGISIYETSGIKILETEPRPKEEEPAKEEPPPKPSSQCLRCGKDLNGSEFCSGCGLMVRIQPSPFSEIRAE